MNTAVSIPEPISKNVFEKYYRLIDHIRHSAEFDKAHDLLALNSLETVIAAIERGIQDKNELQDPSSELVSSAVFELLDSWILVLASWESENHIIQAMANNFIPVLAILENYSLSDYKNSLRHISKLKSKLKDSKYYPDSSRELLLKDLYSKLSQLHRAPASEAEVEHITQAYIFESSQHETLKDLDPTAISQTLKGHFSTFASDIISRELHNYFDLNLQDIFQIDEVEELRSVIRQIDMFEYLERLFFFDDKTENAIWTVNIQINNGEEKYDAAEIGYIMWTFSKCLETIDDIEVELTSWGDGSKWFHLKVTIKSLASKVDLMQLLKLTRQSAEAVLLKKSIEELQKIDAEKDKLIAETKQIEKQSSNIMGDSMADIAHQLSLHDKALDLQKKELELENAKADIRLKNVEVIKQLSEMMKDGILQNNSPIQILINEGLFIDTTQLTPKFGDTELLDIGEKIKSKEETERSTEDFESSSF